MAMYSTSERPERSAEQISIYRPPPVPDFTAKSEWGSERGRTTWPEELATKLPLVRTQGVKKTTNYKLRHEKLLKYQYIVFFKTWRKQQWTKKLPQNHILVLGMALQRQPHSYYIIFEASILSFFLLLFVKNYHCIWGGKYRTGDGTKHYTYTYIHRYVSYKSLVELCVRALSVRDRELCGHGYAQRVTRDGARGCCTGRKQPHGGRSTLSHY